MLKTKVLALVLVVIDLLTLMAQPGSGGCGGTDEPPCDPGAPVPLSGLLVIFLIGLILGIVVINRKKSPSAD